MDHIKNYYVCSHSREKRLLALSHLSIYTHRSTYLTLDGYSIDLAFETFITICQDNPNLVKRRQKYWALCIKMQIN